MSNKIKSEQPLVSIIIPAYNAGNYIREAVDSALAQTYQNKEIIIVDDGSIDDTRKILAPYANKGQIIYVWQMNKGQSSARNMGIKLAHGKFIALLDSDDIFLPNKLKQQVAFLIENPNCGACYCDIVHFYDEEPEKLFKLNYTYYSGDDVFLNLLRMNFINPLTVVLRKSEIDRVGLFDETYRRSEDWEYWIRLVRHGVRFEYLPQVLARYRMRKTSMSYDWKSEIQRKKTTLQIIETVNAAMTPEEQKKYDMPAILLMHRAKLWYAYIGAYLPPLRWLHKWRQENRLK